MKDRPLFSAIPASDSNLGLTDKNIYDKFQQLINDAIEHYNATNDDKRLGNDTKKTLKIAALDMMYMQIHNVDLNHPPLDKASASEFYQLKKELLGKIKEAYAREGITDMARVITYNVTPSRLGNVLANMSQEKREALYYTLQDNTLTTPNLLKRQLILLYGQNDPEYPIWQDICREFSFERLSFSGNSTNIKVTSILDPSAPIKILKIDNRLELPRHIEHQLRLAIPQLLTPVEVTCQVEVPVPDPFSTVGGTKIISRTLLVTDFCTGSSLDVHSQKTIAAATAAGDNNITYLASANIMKKMSQAFLDIQAANCCFPDAKYTNWLMDANGELQVTDTKSFTRILNGKYQPRIPGNEHIDIVRTNGFQPRELRSSTFDAEKLHASLLGRNIYSYLTDQWPPTDPNKSFDWGHPIFSDEIGQEYLSLIKQLIQDPASSRLSLLDAQGILDRLAFKSSAEYQQLIHAYKQLKIDVIEEPGIINPTALALIALCDAEILKNNNPLEKTEAVKAQMSILKFYLSPIQFRPDASMPQIDQLTREFLEQLLALDERCDDLMEEIAQMSLLGQPFMDLNELDKFKLGSLVPDDTKEKSQKKLMKRLKKFEMQLQEGATTIEKTVSDYQTLRGGIQELGQRPLDNEMNKYLEACDRDIASIMQAKTPLYIKFDQINAQIKSMESIRAGLESPANQEIKNIVAKLAGSSSGNLFTLREAAGSILSAMARVPIEQRAQLLNDKQSPELTTLWMAIGEGQKKPVSIHVATSLKGEADISTGRTTNGERVLAEFREKFPKEEPVADTSVNIHFENK